MNVLARLRLWLAEHAPRLFLRRFAFDDRELAIAGEAIAARELDRHGFTIVGRRVRAGRAEIDVLAREGGRLVAVEVKSGRTFTVPTPRGAHVDGRSLRWRPALRVDRAKRERLVRAARELCGERARVDVVEVLVDERSRSVHVMHERGRDGESHARRSEPGASVDRATLGDHESGLRAAERAHDDVRDR